MTLHYNCAVDVMTDVMSQYIVPPANVASAKSLTVITIPILMLWNVRISWAKKLALVGIFSLTVIVIILAIVRVAVVTSHHTQVDISWLYLWSNIEMAVGTFHAMDFNQDYLS
jgi:hypothetical protein